MNYQLIAPCHFGMEAVLKREIEDLGYEITRVEDGRVTFAGDEEAIALANVFLRTAERILIEVGRFEAGTWEELFVQTKSLPWEAYLPEDGRFWVTKASSVKSTLFSPRDIQSVMKKAMVERMKQHCRREWFPETGADYPVRVFIMKDTVTVGIDTSGDSLHKRGYRVRVSKAPISETLAAALIMLTPWKKDRILVDPFCGCGTFPIEAALMAADIAPGMNREFTAMNWKNLISRQTWYDAVDEARERADAGLRELTGGGLKADGTWDRSSLRTGSGLDLQGYDIDEEVVRLARENAEDAGVGGLIHFQARSVEKLSHSGKYGFIITNPPYGERLEEQKNLPPIYQALGNALKQMDTWSAYLITSYEHAERDMGRKAARNRKLYNGMIKTYYYQFPGPKPPGRGGNLTYEKTQKKA